MRVQQPFHIGSVLRNALVFDAKNWSEGPPVNTEKLLETVGRLFALLHERQIDYLLVGGIALLRYVEGRNTEDLDLILAPSSLKELPEIEVTGEEPNFARATFEGLKIDVLLTRNPLFEKVLRDCAKRSSNAPATLFPTGHWPFPLPSITLPTQRGTAATG